MPRNYGQVELSGSINNRIASTTTTPKSRQFSHSHLDLTERKIVLGVTPEMESRISCFAYPM